ncbi:MAG TPA: GH116 family glycosyl hydrolase [Bacteroidota bacterium]|nr:GH116 family glycosyl hydrolase [Bacteroidota bacterium]
MKTTLIFLLILVVFVPPAPAQTGVKKTAAATIQAFPIDKNDIEITRLAQPTQYFDRIGLQAGLMGSENGSFEMWVWPWKPLRNFELSFLLGSSTQPILAADILRTVSITPEAAVFTYTHESFSVREIIFVPRDKPGAVILMDVHTTSPLTIVAGFIPVMQPMWPAGIGGQFSYWNDDPNGYVISEAKWRGVFLCGSPAAKQMAAPPAHMFADNPIQFKVDVAPGEADGRYIPIVIAGGHGMKFDSLKTVYNDLWKNSEKYYRENVEYYRKLRANTVRLTTPDAEMNLALEWGKVALDNLMVRNPNLGYGMVAGYGVSGGGARPGFAWFFGGDAFINALAFDSYGATTTVRDALAFTQKWQRQEEFPIRKNPDRPNRDIGKMSHELSQSDGLCDWWNDYHYGYNHADTSPWYLVAMGDYVRTSGDIGFIRESWNSVKQAYDWCVSKDSDGDGLMDLKGAGLGALEFGKLVGIYSDVYTCAIWAQGIKETAMMAGLVGDTEMKARANAQLAKAMPALEKIFWNDKTGFYSYGATEKKEKVNEKTPWSGVGMMFGLFNADRTGRSLEAFNGADLCTDWGVRSLSRSSELFEPTNYNYGAVWPFIGSFFNTAQFRYGYGLSAHPVLRGVLRHAFDNGAGLVPEVFSGEMNQKLGEAYHHQGFSTTGYILPMLRGLAGLEVNALNGTVTLSPRFPANWEKVELANVAIGSRRYDFTVTRSEGSYSVAVTSAGTEPVRVTFAPGIEPGIRAEGATLNGNPLPGFSVAADPVVTEEMRGGDVLAVRHTAGPAILPPDPTVAPGGVNTGIKIVSLREDRSDMKVLRLTVEGLAGRAYELDLVRGGKIASVNGATIGNDKLRIVFDGKGKSGYVRKEVTLKLKP